MLVLFSYFKFNAYIAESFVYRYLQSNSLYKLLNYRIVTVGY